MPYSMADPRIVDPVDVISDIDKRPNLLELTPKEFRGVHPESLHQDGLRHEAFTGPQATAASTASRTTRIRLLRKFIVQAKLYTRTVQPTHVRDLWGTVQHEGATKGIMITTSGYGPDSYKFAGGKPLNLIDGSGLLSLCQQNDIPARILDHAAERRTARGSRAGGGAPVRSRLHPR